MLATRVIDDVLVVAAPGSAFQAQQLPYHALVGE